MSLKYIKRNPSRYKLEKFFQKNPSYRKKYFEYKHLFYNKKRRSWKSALLQDISPVFLAKRGPKNFYIDLKILLNWNFFLNILIKSKKFLKKDLIFLKQHTILYRVLYKIRNSPNYSFRKIRRKKKLLLWQKYSPLRNFIILDMYQLTFKFFKYFFYRPLKYYRIPDYVSIVYKLYGDDITFVQKILLNIYLCYYYFIFLLKNDKKLFFNEPFQSLYCYLFLKCNNFSFFEIKSLYMRNYFLFNLFLRKSNFLVDLSLKFFSKVINNKKNIFFYCTYEKNFLMLISLYQIDVSLYFNSLREFYASNFELSIPFYIKKSLCVYSGKIIYF